MCKDVYESEQTQYTRVSSDFSRIKQQTVRSGLEEGFLSFRYFYKIAKKAKGRGD